MDFSAVGRDVPAGGGGTLASALRRRTFRGQDNAGSFHNPAVGWLHAKLVPAAGLDQAHRARYADGRTEGLEKQPCLADWRA